LDRFAFALASCQNYPAGFYTAYAHMAEENLDLVAFVGDYIYNGDGQGTIGRGWLPVREVKTLADYRVRLGQVKSDPDLKAAHSAFPWVVTFDDHEVANNWAGDDADPERIPCPPRGRVPGVLRAHASAPGAATGRSGRTDLPPPDLR
jgi:alkaline phosphatase D